MRHNAFVSGKVEVEFAGDAGLRDAYGRLTFGPAARLTVGQFKRPFDGFQLTSSSRILTIERDLDIPGVPGLVAASYDEFTTAFALSSYEPGVMLDGSLSGGRVAYWLGVFNGQPSGTRRDLNSEKQFIARGRYALDSGTLPLHVAVSAALTDRPFVAPDGTIDGEYFANYEIWAELGDFDAGPHVQAGVLLGENPLILETGVPGGGDFANVFAAQAIGAYRFALPETLYVDAVEPVLRVTHANPDTGADDNGVWGLTPGVQLFLLGRNKVALNWDVVVFSSDAIDTVHSVKAQYQFYF